MPRRARADALVRDPWAGALAGPDGMAWTAERTPESVLPIVLRTRYFDDWLVGILAGGAIRQAVLLAAGLDTRAFRLTWAAGARCFEVDRRAVLGHKAAILEGAGARPRCDRRPVEADLAAPWGDALQEAGFDAARPAAWLLEGIMFYLPNDVIRRVLDGVTALAAPGSVLGFDIVNGEMLLSPWTRPWVDMQAAAGAPWIGTMDDPVGELAGLGWAGEPR